MNSSNPESLQYRFEPSKNGSRFLIKKPEILLERERRDRDFAKGMAMMMDRHKRGVNCPDKSIIETRIILDGNVDIFDPVIITNERGSERAYRWVGNIQTKRGEPLSLERLGKGRRAALVENPAKIVYMPKIAIDGEATLGENLYTDSMIQDGGLVFVDKKQARGLVGVWEELEGNGEGAFRMHRSLKKMLAEVS